MEYHYLGRTGLKVSELCLGAMTFGWESTEAESRGGKFYRYRAAWQLQKAIDISRHNGWEPFSCLQPLYNLLDRELEWGLAPVCLNEGWESFLGARYGAVG